MKRILIVFAVVSVAFLLAACDNPTSSDGPSTDQAVVGSINGVVTDSTTGLGIPGVTVTAQTGNGGTGPTTTNAAGYYSIGGLVDGDTVVAFSKDGYTHSTVTATVTGTDAVTDDPWNEIAAVTEAINAALEENGNIYDATGITTLTEGDDGGYTFTASDGSTVNVTIDDNNNALFSYVSGETGLSRQYFTTQSGSTTLTPRSGAISGTVLAAFSTTEDESSSTELIEPAVGAQVRVATEGTDITFGTADDVVYPTAEEPTVTTANDGTFTIENLPIGVDVQVQVLPFEQTSSDDSITVTFDGDGSASLSEIAASITVALNGGERLLEDPIVAEPNYSTIRVVSHNIGSINPPLEIGRPADVTADNPNDIELTFSQGVNPSTFRAYIDFNADSTYDEGSDILLEPTWVADSNNTQVTLLPVVASNNGNGYLPYGLDGSDDAVLVLEGQSLLNGAPFDTYNVNSDGNDGDFAGIVTEDGLMIEQVDFLDASDNVTSTQFLYDVFSDTFYDYTADGSTVAPGGSIRLDFNKELTAGTVEVEFFDDANTNGDAEPNEEVLPANKVVTAIDGTDASILTITVPSQLSTGTEYMVAIRVKSTDADGDDVYNSDPDGNIFFTYDSLLLPFAPGTDPDLDNVDTNINLEAEDADGASVVNFDATGVAGRASNDFGYTDAIEIEFNQALTGNTVALYHWDDPAPNGDGDGAIDDNELTELTNGTDYTVTTAADSVNGTADTVLVITPAGQLYPGKTFVLDVEATSASSTFDLNPETFYVFQVEADPEDIVIPSDLAAYPYDIENFAFTGDADSTDTTITLDFDTLQELYDENGMFTFVFQPSGTGDWFAPSANTTADNKTRLARFFDSTQQITHTLDGETSEIVYDDGTSPPVGLAYNYLVYDNSIDYLVFAYNEKGLIAYPDAAVTVEDTVGPTTTPDAQTLETSVAGADFVGLTYTANAGTSDDTWTNNDVNGDGTAVEFDTDYSVNERFDEDSVSISGTFTDTNVTVALSSADGTTGYIVVTVTVPNGANLTAGDEIQIDFDDLSGNSVTEDNDNNAATADDEFYLDILDFDT